VKSLDRKQRFDMSKNGLEITAKPVASAAEEAQESSKAATN
jgi:hypothetical protein